MPTLVTRPADPVDASVLVHLVSDPLADPEREWQWLGGLEKSLAEAVASAGEIEGVYLIGEEWVVCAHGPSIDPLWEAMSKVLARWPLPANSYALHRPATKGAMEVRVAIGGEAPCEVVGADRPVSSTWRTLSEQGLLAAVAMCAVA